ncbi:hypothetical protein A1O7_00778 [Cladophialophora yegresii CBS 114405]|uniref:BZIP domain-containing protein n=1 Tax=Cladophialophora yegresii CBS 114405 TaxID=1182544 RepID=W9W8L0_9EURO|nr:uncharacterized protein A1O7_00778 [Cladophialophora yegresii CBS 114405]EXJ64442.1 hypothetical protein A1O7_00778 [Cladophialophora yegresii CBS 114405]
MQHDAGHSVASPASPSQPADSNDLVPSSTSLAGRKRKAGGAGSRGVASLTPEQLAKKRANDRDAQRAIRERTKHTIENLERRIEELTSQQPYQELQEVIRQKDAIQAENEEIRRRLASVMSLIQPIIGAQGLTDLATAAQNNVQAGIGRQTPHPAFTPATSASPNPAYFTTQQHGRTAFSGPPSTTHGQMGASAYQPAFTAEGTEEARSWPVSRDALSLQRDNLQRGLELNDSGERVNFSFLLDSFGLRPSNSHLDNLHSPQQSPPSSQHPAYTTTAASLSEHLQVPAAPWSILPKIGPPTCPLDRLLLNFLHSREREPTRANGTVPPSYPSVSSLLNPSGNLALDPLSQFMTDIISKFPDISELPSQVATLFCMFSLMRWQIHPTQENYERLPEWLHPVPIQLYTSHPAWIDHLPWPRLREKLVANSQDYPFDNWFIPFTSGLSVNWPYDPVDCLLSTSEQDEPVMNPVFERHIRRLENWSLGSLFADTFPELVETTRISDRESMGITPSLESRKRDKSIPSSTA